MILPCMELAFLWRRFAREFAALLRLAAERRLLLAVTIATAPSATTSTPTSPAALASFLRATAALGIHSRILGRADAAVSAA